MWTRAQSYTPQIADKWAGHESHLPSPCRQPVSVSLPLPLCVCVCVNVCVGGRRRRRKSECKINKKSQRVLFAHICMFWKMLCCLILVILSLLFCVNVCVCACVCVCFHLIHLRVTGRIRVLHQSPVSDSVTPRDPTFTWVLLDCGSLLSLLLSLEEEGWERRRIKEEEGYLIKRNIMRQCSY